MNRRAIVIVAALLALSAAFTVRRRLRKGEHSAPPPEAVEAPPSSPLPESPLTGATMPAQPFTAASSPQAVATSTNLQLRPIGEAIEASYASTIAAFALHGEEADYEAHDARAQSDADRLQGLFSSMRTELSPELASSCEAVIDRIAAAQLQLMAFAINRKNRGLPDSAQVEAELADRTAFQADVAPLFERVQAALRAEGINISR